MQKHCQKFSIWKPQEQSSTGRSSTGRMLKSYHPDLQSFSAPQDGVKTFSSARQVQILQHIHKKRTGKMGVLSTSKRKAPWLKCKNTARNSRSEKRSSTWNENLFGLDHCCRNLDCKHMCYCKQRPENFNARSLIAKCRQPPERLST